MKRYGFLALAALALIGFTQVAGYGYTNITNSSEGCFWVYMYPNGSTPGSMGASPDGTAACPVPVLICPPPCDPAAVESRCGAFCAAGQKAPGWPYGWCDGYWERPDTNY